MTRWKGTVRKLDLGPGAWVLETGEGEQHPLHGPIPEELEGRYVTVQGEEEEAMGFAMTGANPIRVQKVEPEGG